MVGMNTHLPSYTMPYTAEDVVHNSWIIRYGISNFWNTYYTCIPSNKKGADFECIKGLTDTVYAEDALFRESLSWREESVPWYIPAAKHEAYLNRKYTKSGFQIYNGRDCISMWNGNNPSIVRQCLEQQAKEHKQS
jgi:hypothetical protein